MTNKSVFNIATGCFVAVSGVSFAQQSEKPNVIVILADDLGSCDVGFGGCLDIPTPNIDRIAYEGVNCTNAYISAPYSGPSRCGLMTGRYQQRFGVDGNIENLEDSCAEMQGVPTSELMLLELMQDNGYKTAAIGKWHMGDHEDLKPHSRGTDYSYGFSNGGYNYWGIPNKEGGTVIEENGKPVDISTIEYLTDSFSEKTVEFIEEQAKSDDPFFVYLAYNAPHAPMQATQKYLDRTEHIFNSWRSIYAAMILSMDDGVGLIWDKLEELNIADNTMIIFLSDNGGTNLAMNYPLRAFKGNMFDGGIRTPFAIYYKGVLDANQVYEETISSLDIFPTVAAAAGINTDKVCKKKPLDGVDLVPYLTGEVSGTPNNKLFWRVCGGMEYATRQGDYKLVKRHDQDEFMLFDVVKDPIEMYDIAAENPALVKRMKAEYDAWESEMMDPRWEDLHAPHQIEDLQAWKDARKKALRPSAR
ncbi:MAG: sulfatase-like hydrolase/transferase [Rikenellaceae bacterium]